MKRFEEYAWYHKFGDSAANPRVLAAVSDIEHYSTQDRADLCYFYSLTYCIASALRIMQERDRIIECPERAAEALRPHLLFQTDRRYVACNNLFEKALAHWGDELSFDVPALSRSLVGDSGELSFSKAIPTIERFPSFGRYAAYLYAETIETLMELPLTADFSHVEYDSGRVFSAGLLHLFWQDSAAERFEKKGLSSFEGGAEMMNRYLARLMEYLKKTLGPVSIYQVETSLCAYRKFFKGTRYNGYYADRQLDEVSKMTSRVDSGIISTIFEARARALPAVYLGEAGGWGGFRKELRTHYQENQRINGCPISFA